MKRIMKLQIIGVCLVLWALNSATGQILKPLSRSEAVSQALQANFDIRIQQVNTEAAKAGISRGLAGQLPRISVNVGEQVSSNSVIQEFSNAAQATINRNGAITTATTGSLNLGWTLFDGMAMFINYERQKTLYQLSAMQQRAVIELTTASVLLAYDNLLLQNERLKLLEANLKLTKDRVQLAQDQFDAGTGSKLDLLNASVDLNADKSAILTQNRLIDLAKADLNLLMAQQPETAFSYQGQLFIADSLNLNAISDQIEGGNVSLLLAQLNQEVLWQQVRLAQASRYPTVALNAGFNFSDQNFQAGLFKRNATYGPFVGVSASMNLFNGGVVQNAIKQAEFAKQSGQLAADEVKLQLKHNIYRLKLDYTNARQLVKLEQANQAVAKQNTEVALERYKAGLARPLEVREAQQNELAASTRLLEAKFQVRTAEIGFMRLLGKFESQ